MRQWEIRKLEQQCDNVSILTVLDFPTRVYRRDLAVVLIGADKSHLRRKIYQGARRVSLETGKEPRNIVNYTAVPISMPATGGEVTGPHGRQ